MDFFTDLMGLILLIVCILIVLIFLKDYIRLGGKKTTINKKQKIGKPILPMKRIT